MKKTFEFSADDEKYILKNTNPNDEKYILKNTNPNDEKESFMISKKEMQFDTNAFYKYVFSDIISEMEVEIVDKTVDDDKAAKRVYGIVSEISKEVMKKMNDKCLQNL